MSEAKPPGQAPTGGVASRAARSAAWMYGRMAVANVTGLVSLGILARELRPVDFGVVAFAHSMLHFLAALTTGGVGQFVIADRAENHLERANAAFWLNLIGSLVAGGAAFALLPVLAGQLDHAQATPLLALLIVKLVIDLNFAVPEALVKRTLEMRSFVLRDTLLEVLGSAASIAMALAGMGLWSLVWPQLAVSLVRTLAAFWIARWIPSPSLGLRHWRPVARFTANVMGFNLVALVTNEGDALLIGGTLGAHALAIYRNAWAVANLVQKNTVGVVSKLALPALSAVAHSGERLRAGFRRMLRVLALACLPAYAGLFVLADVFVLVLFGPQWTDAVLPLRILIIFAARRAIGSPASSIYAVVGRPEIGFHLGLAVLPFYLAGIYLGAYWGGIVGVAVGVTLVRSVFGFVQFAVTASLIGDTFVGVMRPITPALAASLLMGGLVYCLRLLVESQLALPPVATLLGATAAGAVLFVILLRIGFASVRDDVVQLCGSLSPGLARLAGRLLAASKPPR